MTRAPGVLAALALALGAGAWIVLELALRALGAVPPDDPLLFYTRTQVAEIQPFVRAADGALEIRSDWVNDGRGLRGRRGARAGRQFLLPGFRPARVVQPKPEGTLRLVALGGSTTYGLYVGADDAFPAVLGRLLAQRLPERRVEVVNLGCPGFASDRVAALAPAAVALAPDLVVVLTGHNEMLSGALGMALTPGQRLRAALIRHSVLVAWWNHWLSGWLRGVEAQQVREEVAAVRAGEIPTFVPEDVPATQREAPSAAFRAAAAARFEANLERLVGTLRDAGIPVLFVLPAPNLRAPPLALPDPGAPEPQGLREALRAADALRDAGKPEAALARLDEAVAAAPRDPRPSFARGLLLLALGRDVEGRAALEDALDRDARTHRITRPLRDVLERVLSRAGVPWVDATPVLGALDPDTAQVLFVDHLHPTAEGHARLARALLPQALAALAAREREAGGPDSWERAGGPRAPAQRAAGPTPQVSPR